MTDQTSNEPVLSDDEKSALLDGMSTGEVEVHSSSGPSYASVTAFEVAPRSRIVTHSYPRLQSLNREFAGRISKQVEVLLNAECSVTFNSIQTCTYSDFGEQGTGLSLLLEFSPRPLKGSALINLDAALVEFMVETFYGGSGNEPAQQDSDFFTPGEVNVATLFGRSVIGITAEVWKPMTDLDPELLGSHLNSGVIDSVDGGDTVIAAEFELAVGDKKQNFQLIWPLGTVASLLPVFEGQKRERDVAEDARWEQSIRARVVDSIVNISSNVGKTQMKLGDITDLTPGDVITIGNPQKSTVFARQVAVLEGRFGVHQGRYAIEAKQWLDPDSRVEPATN